MEKIVVTCNMEKANLNSTLINFHDLRGVVLRGAAKIFMIVVVVVVVKVVVVVVVIVVVVVVVLVVE